MSILNRPGWVAHLPNSPENQFAKCLLLMLGVKLITLSVSPSLAFSRSGVCGSEFGGTVLLRGRVVIVLWSLLRKLSGFAVRLVVVGVGLSLSSFGWITCEVEVVSTKRMVAPKGLCRTAIDAVVRVEASPL
jgi:hypothetical protein